MQKFLIGAAIVFPLSFAIVPATALPGPAHGAVTNQLLSSSIVEVKKGGRGGGKGWGRVHGFKPHGWSRGRKLGWRGMTCPPGHWKKGWC